MSDTVESCDDVLAETFARVGREHGFEDVKARYADFKDFKVRWQRSYKWADFSISDYLMDAPAPVIESMARAMFDKIDGKEGSEGYPRELCDWVTAPGFCDVKQQVYLHRSRNLTRSPRGEFRSLRGVYERLMALGLAQDDPTICLTWTKDAKARKMDHTSVLMRTIEIAPALDTLTVPEYVLDFTVWYCLCHILAGFDPTGRRQQDIDDLIARYPRRDEAMAELKIRGWYL